ncbi:MAG: polymerase III, alpha subunit protein [Parcubacteria group bacterium GW2011_GWA1_47_11]|nr:MAG: polymerase III, alpha subunit protein [Parcubacteria group bacterium GW2011_GWA1_47_11]
MNALALTDSGNLYGAIEFYKECLEQEIKPIIGVDFYVALRSRNDKETRVDNERGRLLVLAENNLGYQNLLKLVTDSYLEGFYYKPRVDRELLEKYNEGLIAISKEPKWYREIFGDRFYLGVGPENLPNLDKKSGDQVVAVYNTHYLEPTDRPILDTLVSIQGHLDRNSAFDEQIDLSFVSQEQAKEDFKNFPEAIENTVKIAERCNVELELGKWIFPNYVVASGKSYDEELRAQVYSGFKRRNLAENPEIIERVEYELRIIKGKGFSPYFLVVSDLLKYAREQGILANIRGSVMGSIVTYLSGITNVNPLEYNLRFERFLNPDRPSAPDIDMDFADTRRDEMINYVKGKYGVDHVAQIGTFGTMMARGAVRDVTRALDFSYALGDKIAKLIPLGAQGFPMTIDRAMKENPELQKLYKEDRETKTIIDMAKKIEGNARHISVHAAGVVIAPNPLVEYTPLQYDTKGEGKIITQYDMYSITDEYGGVGLLKFDFLGLRNLSIIADTVERINKIEGVKIDIENIALDDKKTFDLLARGETEGTFQLNGNAMTKFLMELKPSAIHDIHAMVALYRPGPMQFIPLFIERKRNPSLVTYPDPALKPILERTYGVLVYQDDLLMIARDIAGYSWGEVDKFRKAVGKKIPAEMAAQKEKFIRGCMEHSGWQESKAWALWDWIEPFAAYGFNKAHSVSYGHVAYQTAWLKANFPAIYMSAVLTAESGDVEKIGVMIKECSRMGIEVLPPSINESFSQFTVVNNPPSPYKIRFGLTTIKNFGQGISSSITAERKHGGKFQSLSDFLDRVKDKNLNKKSLESLIKCGALDEFGERGMLLSNIDDLLGYHRERMSAPKNQDSLFGLMTDTSTLPALRLSPGPAASQREKLLWEKELLGLYISGHPLEAYKDKLLSIKVNIEKLSSLREGTETVIAGIVEEARDVLTKGNERMVFMRLADLSGVIEVAIFPRILDEFRSFIQPEACIAIKGKVSKRKGETSFIAEKIKSL